MHGFSRLPACFYPTERMAGFFRFPLNSTPKYGAPPTFLLRRTFFKPTKRKSADDLWVLHYEPRAATVVEDIKRQTRAEEERKALVSDFARFAVAAAGAPRGEKPAPPEWEQNESFAMRTAALRRFAMDDLEDDSDRRIASEVLDAMGCPKNPAVVFELLVKMGVLQAHSSLELMTGAIRSAFPDEVQAVRMRSAHIQSVSSPELITGAVWNPFPDEVQAVRMRPAVPRELRHALLWLEGWLRLARFGFEGEWTCASVRRKLCCCKR